VRPTWLVWARAPVYRSVHWPILGGTKLPAALESPSPVEPWAMDLSDIRVQGEGWWAQPSHLSWRARRFSFACKELWSNTGGVSLSSGSLATHW